jgi:hypothetical protein
VHGCYQAAWTVAPPRDGVAGIKVDTRILRRSISAVRLLIIVQSKCSAKIDRRRDGETLPRLVDK